MSDVEKPLEVVAQIDEGQVTKNPEISLEDEIKLLRAEKLQDEKTKSRLLNESKESKAKWQLLRDEHDKKEKDLLTKNENFKGLYEKERDERLTEKQGAQTFKQNTLSKLIEYEILKYAPDALDVNLVKQALPIEMLNAIEQDNEIKLSGFKEGIDKVKKEKSFLFKPQNMPSMMSAKPGNQNARTLTGGVKTLEQMSREEVIDLWRSNPKIT